MSRPQVTDLVRPKRSLPGQILRAVLFFRRPVARLIWIIVLAGLLLRFTIRDSRHPWALIYYLTPIPALPIWVAIAGLLWREKPSPTRSPAQFSGSRLHGVAVTLFVLWTIATEYETHAPLQQANAHRIVFWNTARVPLGVHRVARQIRDWDPAAIGLVEANTFFPRTLSQWRHELPDYQIATTHFGGMLAVKGTIKNQVCHALLPTSWCEQFDVNVDGKDFTVLLVDISATLILTRRQPLQDLADLSKKLADRPLVIMGDFNTPDDSILMEPLHAHCQLAFRERGSGYAATWPMPLPALTLDQVWINSQVTVAKSEYGWSLDSDHRPAICHLSLDAPNR